MPPVSLQTFTLFRGLTERGREITPESVSRLCVRHPEEAAGLQRIFEEYRRARSSVSSSSEAILAQLESQLCSSSEVDEPAREAFDELQGRLLERLRSGPGKRSERYSGLEEIGVGGGGTVFQAWDQDLRRRLALKSSRFRLDPGGNGLAVSRFLDEAQITGQLDHPGVVPVHDLGLDAHGRLFYTMRLVKGWDLHAVIGWVHGQQAPPEAQAWSLLRIVGVLLKVCETMAYVHGKGVIHRDLKPSNVMVGRFGQVHVMDWGAAKLVDRPDRPDRRDLRPRPAPSVSIQTHRKGLRAARAEEDDGSALTTMDGMVIGTPAYMPPEQAEGRIADVDARSDVYAVGAVLYYALCGHSPYVRPGAKLSPRTVLAMVLNSAPARVSDEAKGVPAELQAICEKAMARAPERRYQDMSAMAEDLRAFLEGRVVGAMRTGPLGELRKWTQRNPAATAACALALALLAFASFFVSNQRVLAAEKSLSRELASDQHLFDALAHQVEQLLPPRRERAAEMQAWIARFEQLAQRRALHEGRAEPVSIALLKALDEAQVSGGLLERMRRRMELARATARETLESESARALWQRAAREVAQNPIYAGLQLEPQEGLLPLGPDPQSELQEFAHFQSGALPAAREGESIRMQPETCLIFVLIPAGRYQMGAQRRSPDEPSFYSKALANEGPTREVELAAFLLSKFELTQGQWYRLSGERPAMFRAQLEYPQYRIERGDFDDRHPIESVSWHECERVFGRWGLEFPSEGQWEWAARCGPELRSAEDDYFGSPQYFVNVADEAFKGVEPNQRSWEPYDDGFAMHAPVGSFEPSRWGLHDMIGNVSEWCAIEPAALGVEPRRGEAGDSGLRVLRGGDFNLRLAGSRPTGRQLEVPDRQEHSWGVRPALPLGSR